MIIDKILMLEEGQMGARGTYIGIRRQAPELGPMRYAYAWPAHDNLLTYIETRHHYWSKYRDPDDLQSIIQECCYKESIYIVAKDH